MVRVSAGWPAVAGHDKGGTALLTCPDDAMHERHFVEREAAFLEGWVERAKLDALRGEPRQLLGHHFASLGLDHHAIAAAHACRWRHDDAVAVAIDGQHRL